MPFRQLTEAECGQANPLSKLTSHVTQDHIFSDSHGQVFPGSSDQLVEQFLQETRAVPQTFRMDDLMREMHEIESQRSVLPPIPASAVKDHLQDNAWAQQYLEDGKIFHETNHNEVWSQIVSEQQKQQNFSTFEDIWHEHTANQQAGPSDTQRTAHDIRTSIDDPRFVYSKFMRFMNKVEDGVVNLDDGKLTQEEAEAWSNEFLAAEAKADPDKLSQIWSEEHTAPANNTSENMDEFWKNMQQQLSDVEHDFDYETPWADEFEIFNSNKEYEFVKDNPMFDVNDPLERGKKLLESGDFPSAVLCFEAAVQKQQDSAEAWFLLGKTQAENEQDQHAIPALLKCLELDPTNLDAIMALAVSYTNECYHNQACNLLLRWLKTNPKYQDLVPPDLNLSWQVQSLLNPGQHKVVQDLYIKAAQKNPLDIDYEVQSGLGVLFNLTNEFDKAADCFRAALSVKPEDARLWNRLGATLANGSKSEEAVDSYHHALQIAPGFIRCRYNVGITCINLQSYKEAAEHFLTALNQQARGADVVNTNKTTQMSDSIWSTLRMCVSFMNRKDLKELVDKRDLKALNEQFNLSIDS